MPNTEQKQLCCRFSASERKYYCRFAFFFIISIDRFLKENIVENGERLVVACADAEHNERLTFGANVLYFQFFAFRAETHHVFALGEEHALGRFYRF